MKTPRLQAHKAVSRLVTLKSSPTVILKPGAKPALRADNLYAITMPMQHEHPSKGKNVSRGITKYHFPCLHFDNLLFSSRKSGASQSSQIVSKFRSLLFSAPQTLHLFLLSLPPNPPVLGTTPLPAPTADDTPLGMPYKSKNLFRSSRCRLSSSTAKASASGVSGIVSREEIDGERDRVEVGVLGMEEESERERPW